jgi:hypothetical protein
MQTETADAIEMRCRVAVRRKAAGQLATGRRRAGPTDGDDRAGL